MSTVRVPVGATEQTIRIVVHNADGTVKEDRGVVSYWHKNPIKRWAGNAAIRARGLLRELSHAFKEA